MELSASASNATPASCAVKRIQSVAGNVALASSAAQPPTMTKALLLTTSTESIEQYSVLELGLVLEDVTAVKAAGTSPSIGRSRPTSKSTTTSGRPFCNRFLFHRKS